MQHTGRLSRINRLLSSLSVHHGSSSSWLEYTPTLTEVSVHFTYDLELTEDDTTGMDINHNDILANSVMLMTVGGKIL